MYEIHMILHQMYLPGKHLLTVWVSNNIYLVCVWVVYNVCMSLTHVFIWYMYGLFHLYLGIYMCCVFFLWYFMGSLHLNFLLENPCLVVNNILLCNCLHQST